MIYVVGILLLLGPLVFIHELGHYLAAKLCGVRVEVFSLGFGKRLLGFKRGDTDYRISALPLGGYVRMSGENPMEENTGDPGEFMSHPRWQRFIIAIAGPLMNGVLAIALLAGLYMVHHPDQRILKQPAVVQWVQPNSMASKVGLQPGDQIVQLDTTDTPDWRTLFDRLSLLGPKPLPLYVERGTQRLEMQISAPANGEAVTLGVGPDETTIAEMVSASSPGAAAGIKPGDELTKINGKPVHLFSQVSEMTDEFQKTKGAPIVLTLKRNGNLFDVSVTPKLDADNRYRIGVGFAISFPFDKLSFPDAVNASLAENGKNSFLIVQVLEGLIEKKVSLKQMSSVVGIAQISGEALRAGWPVFIEIMALISLNLGIFNLLPIPILDGGLILLLVIEAVLRRDIKREVKEMVYQAAFVFLVIFAVVVIYNDIAKIVVAR